MSNVNFGFRVGGESTGNAPYSEGVNVATSASFTITAGGANVCEVAITLVDGKGNTVAGAQPMLVWLSDAATGAGLTATSASGTVQAKSASGADFGTLTAKKALIVQPLATGIYTLEITDTAKTGFYVAAQNPYSGQNIVSRQLITADYGS
jgi:hypothetical protein